MNKGSLRISTLMMAFLFLTSCAAPVQNGANDPITEEIAGGQETVNLDKVVLGFQPFMSSSPFIIGIEEGYFEEQGIEVELVPMPAAAQLVPALAGGELDAIGVAVVAATFNLTAQTENRIVAQRTIVDPAETCIEGALVARNELLADDFLEDPNNVTGLQVSTTKGALFEYAVEAKLEQLGLTPEDVVFVEIQAQPARLEALVNEGADIVTFPEPWITRAVNSGEAGVWESFSALIPNAPQSVIMYGPRMLEDEDLGNRFMLAYALAVEQYNQGKTERNIEILSGFLEMSPEDLEATCWPIASNEPGFDETAWHSYQEWLVAKGYLEEVIGTEIFWDGRFIEYAYMEINK